MRRHRELAVAEAALSAVLPAGADGRVATQHRQGAARVAVIGAGFGGIALAIRLQAAGIATTLIEMRDKPGGRAYVYEDNGFVFDAGPTVITDPSAFEDLFALSGRKLEDYVKLSPVEPYYRLIWNDGSTLDYGSDQDALEREIARRSPGDVEGYRRFLAYSEELRREGYERLGAVSFLDPWRMLASAPALVRLQAYRSVYAKVRGFITDEKLRQAFSFHSLLVGGNPFTASSVYALIHALEKKGGVWFAHGGTRALVDGLVCLFRDLGGTLRLGTPVCHIAVEGRSVTSVRLESGETLAVDAVASNADVVHTYDRLLAGTRRGAAMSARLKRSRFSMSLFVVHFGLRRRHPNLKRHTVLFGPRYRGLIHDIFNSNALPSDFSLYLHAPSGTDPSVAPEGCSTFYALSPVPHLGTAPIDWAEEAPRYRDRILSRLEERLIPGLRADLVTCRTFSPADFGSELNAHLGSAFSLEPILTQSAWFRPHNRDDVIDNLYIVGAGTHPGAGLPGVVASAKATAALMTADASRWCEARA